MIYTVRLEHYKFDSVDKEGVSTAFSEHFSCNDIQLLAMKLFAYGRVQLNSYSSRPDFRNTMSWLDKNSDSCTKWMVDECGKAMEPEKFIPLLIHRDWLEAFFETVESDLPEEFEYYDNRGDEHQMFQPGGVVSVKVID